MKKPKRYAFVLYNPPHGAARTCKFVAEHNTHNGIWWELQPLSGGATFRARPGACSAQ